MTIGDSSKNRSVKPSAGIRLDYSSNLTRGLVGYWSFQSGAGQTAFDISGNKNDGPFIGSPKWIPGKYGPALMLSGSAQYIRVPTNPVLKPTGAITIAFWAKPTATGSSLRLIDCENAGGSVGYVIAQGLVSGWLCRIGGTITNTSTGILTLNIWQHVCATYDGANIRLYINGIVVDTKAKTGAIGYSGSSDVFIGSIPTVGSYWPGAIDDGRIYNRALSSQEIKQLVLNPLQSYASQKSHYFFGSSLGFSVTENSIPSNHTGSTFVIHVVGTGTSWTGSTTWTATGVSGWSVSSKTFVDATHYTLTLACPNAASPPAGAIGTLTITDTTDSLTAITIVATPTISASPNTGSTGGNAATTFTGANTYWVGDNPTLTLSGGTGASIGATTNTTNTSSTATVTYGSAAATLTITDPSTGSQTTVAVSSGPVTLLVNDANWFFAPGCWYVNGSTAAESTHQGAYMKIGFTGTTAKLNIDNSILAGLTNPITIAYSIDDAPFTTSVITNATTQVNMTGTPLSAGNHVVMIYNYYVNFTQNRWNNSTPRNALKVIGLLIDAGATSFASGSWNNWKLRTKRGIVFGDSITEGIYSLNSSGQDGYLSYVHGLSYGLDCEFGPVGFASAGYVNTGSGNVPAFNGSYNLYYASQSRSFSGLDYVVLCYGRNDYTATQTPSGTAGTVANKVKAVLGSLRAANGTMKIFVVYPFGQGATIPITGVSGGYTDYQSATPDALTYLVDCGTNIAQGLGGANGSAQSAESVIDSVHPNATTHGKISAVLSAKIQSAIGGGGTGVVGGFSVFE